MNFSNAMIPLYRNTLRPDLSAMKKEVGFFVKKLEYYNSIINLLSWDLSEFAPKNAIEERAEMIAFMQEEMMNLILSDRMGEMLDEIEHQKDLDEVTSMIVQRLIMQRAFFMTIPADKYNESLILTTRAEKAWYDARITGDFSAINVYIRDIVDLTKDMIYYYRAEIPFNTNYDALLHLFEPTFDTRKIDPMFASIRKGTDKLLGHIYSSDHDWMRHLTPRNAPAGPFSNDGLYELSRIALDKIGFCFNSGSFHHSNSHPYMLDVSNRDVRISARTNPTDVWSNLLTICHEGGHGIYEQNIPDFFKGTYFGGGISMAMHESQSKFFENHVAQNLAFVQLMHPHVIKTFPQMKKVTPIDFYRHMHRVARGVNRITSDEVNFNLHIIIRYEIEKMLFNDKIMIEELPALWAEKYKEYLNVEPRNIGESFLQDSHWAAGAFGYFPSYLIGNVFSAQFRHAMSKEFDFVEQIKNDNIRVLRDWLVNNVYKYGSIADAETVLMVSTGERAKEKHFMNYLEEKYSEIYGF